MMDASFVNFDSAKSIFQLENLLLAAGEVIEHSEGLMLPTERLGR
jgi:hypothetical protein